MAYSLISHTASGTNSGGTTSGGIDTTGADLLVVAAAYYNASPPPTLSDSRGNTWTGLTVVSGVGGRVSDIRFYYCQSPSVGSGHTFALAGASSYAALAVAAFSGSASSPADQQGGYGGSDSPGSITPSEAGELVITMAAESTSGAGATAVSGGFTILDILLNSDGNYFGIGLAYLIQGAAAAASPIWSAGDLSAASAIASFKAGSGGGGGGVFSWANYYYRHVAGLSA